MINTLEEALDRIKELEAENKQLLSELETEIMVEGRNMTRHGWLLIMTLLLNTKVA